MKRVDLNGFAAGIALGVPLTIINNPGLSIPGHMTYVLGVVLFCWAMARFIGMFYKPS